MAASGLVLNPSPTEDFRFSTPLHNLEPFGLAGKPIRLFLAMLGPDSSMVPLEVSRDDTIASIKIKIQARKGFYVDQQRLVYGGRELTQDQRPVQDYGVSDGDTIHLVLRLSDVVAITVKTGNGSTFVYSVRRNDCVRDLKRRISDREGGLPLDQQLLTYEGEHLEDSTIIQDLSLGREAVLCLRVLKPSKFRSKFIGRRDLELLVTAPESLSQPEVTISKEDVLPRVGVVSALSVSNEVPEFKPIFSSRSSSENVGKNKHQLLPLKFVHDPVSPHTIFKYPIGSEVSESLRDLVERVKMGLDAGQAPKLTLEGSGGVYLMKDECGLHNVAVFKPRDEEPMAVNNPRGFSSAYFGEGLKKGTRSGEGAIREVAAYILDYPAAGPMQGSKKDKEGFAGVPPTTMIRCYHEAFNYSPEDCKMYRKPKIGSLQQFVHALSSCEDMGSSMFPVEEVHKITVLDLRLANADRNGGNILVCKGDSGVLKLVPIDHGYCFPENFEECIFEWLYWPQACQPYGADALEYIESLDAEQDIVLLRQCGWSIRPQCARVLRVSTMLLKKGAAAGLTPFQIGCIMSRGESLDTKSPIELMLEEAEVISPRDASEGDCLRILANLLDEYIVTVKAV